MRRAVGIVHRIVFAGNRETLPGWIDRDGAFRYEQENGRLDGGQSDASDGINDAIAPKG
jgi:hypothetical protein